MQARVFCCKAASARSNLLDRARISLPSITAHAVCLFAACSLQADAGSIESPWLCSGDITNLPDFALRLIDKQDPVSQFLDETLSPECMKALAKWQSGDIDQANLENVLIRHLNSDILTDVSIYDAKRFSAIKLRSETKLLLDRNPNGNDLLYLNRLLLEDAYPFDISRSHKLITNSPPEGISAEQYEKMMQIPLYRHFMESPGIEVQTRQFLARVKSKIKPKDLQLWADSLLKGRKLEGHRVRLQRGDIPDFILKLDPPLEPSVAVLPSYVSVDWGGGFGFWGLFIGDKSSPSNTNLFTVEWVPGIYAYHTRDL